MFVFIKKHLPEILLTCFVIIYAIYFSLFTINRAEKLYAHYFDLGIMHQTVYNTYKAIQTVDPSRVLELTDPHTTAQQVKRMSVHNDMLLALLAPFYFIHDGPETILIIQSLVLAIGAVFIFLIAKKVLKDVPLSKWLALSFSISYLLYPPMEKANVFEFHAVTLATTFMLAMFYYYLVKQYKKSFIFLALGLLTKEQVGMTTAFFGLYILYDQYKNEHIKLPKVSFLQKSIKWVKKEIKTRIPTRFAAIIIGSSLIWILLSMLFIIPLSRGEEHFASKYYNHIKERPIKLITFPLRATNLEYAKDLLGPVGFLSLASPAQLLITVPELGVNLLSNNANMRNTYFHYDSLLTPFIFISSIYGVLFLYFLIKKQVNKEKTTAISAGLGVYILLAAVLFAYTDGILPFAKNPDNYPWREPEPKYYEVIAWEKILDDDQIKVSATGKLSPHFTSRQYFYDFSWKYTNADYVIIEEHDAQYGYLKAQSIPAYKDLQNDKNYIKIYDENGIEVYRRLAY